MMAYWRKIIQYMIENTVKLRFLPLGSIIHIEGNNLSLASLTEALDLRGRKFLCSSRGAQADSSSLALKSPLFTCSGNLVVGHRSCLLLTIKAVKQLETEYSHFVTEIASQALVYCLGWWERRIHFHLYSQKTLGWILCKSKSMRTMTYRISH